MRRLLTLGQPHRNTAIRAHLQSRRSLALLGALVLCLFAFVLAHNEAWAAEQPSSTEQQQLSSTEQQRPTVESTTIVNGKQVAEPAPAPTSPPVSSTPPVEMSAVEKPPPPPADSVPPKAEPEPAPQPTPLQHTVVITTTGGETVWPGAKPVPAYRESEPAPTTTTTTTPTEPAPAPASAAPTPDLGSPETEIPAAAEEELPGEVVVPAALPIGLSAPSEAPVPMVAGPALQQVAQEVASQGQARPVFYSSSGITPADTAVQPLARALTDLVGMNTAAAASAVADVLGIVEGWLAESTSGETESPSGGIPQQPFAPLIPEPLGSSYISLFSGGGQTSAAGGAGATLLLGVLSLASILLLRRDIRTYLVSCELPKPSSALLSPLERPG